MISDELSKLCISYYLTKIVFGYLFPTVRMYMITIQSGNLYIS